MTWWNWPPRVHVADGKRLVLDLPEAAEDVLRNDSADREYLAVYGPDGRLISGDAALQPDPVAVDAAPRLANSKIHGEKVRKASYRRSTELGADQRCRRRDRQEAPAHGFPHLRRHGPAQPPACPGYPGPGLFRRPARPCPPEYPEPEDRPTRSPRPQPLAPGGYPPGGGAPGPRHGWPDHRPTGRHRGPAEFPGQRGPPVADPPGRAADPARTGGERIAGPVPGAHGEPAGCHPAPRPPDAPAPGHGPFRSRGQPGARMAGGGSQGPARSRGFHLVHRRPRPPHRPRLRGGARRDRPVPPG